ncbi:hypothetical protein [Streptomyces sp. NBC_00091]|uniref:hypothetical protein n=1 Tax=Streptomyces sp. NBC_00091 TaxID=2975648 RepID=UPI00224E929F|nr:hypothetical protein [Streptomyces sp. NBC_00091]MCX5377221.1 hypothetical protein [Streptomyces sp. NBC_00091]
MTGLVIGLTVEELCGVEGCGVFLVGHCRIAGQRPVDFPGAPLGRQWFAVETRGLVSHGGIDQHHVLHRLAGRDGRLIDDLVTAAEPVPPGFGLLHVRVSVEAFLSGEGARERLREFVGFKAVAGQALAADDELGLLGTELLPGAETQRTGGQAQAL